LVSVKFTEESNSEETIFVIIKDHEIVETNTDVKVGDLEAGTSLKKLVKMENSWSLVGFSNWFTL
jgi:hypothetical protein